MVNLNFAILLCRFLVIYSEYLFGNVKKISFHVLKSNRSQGNIINFIMEVNS